MKMIACDKTDITNDHSYKRSKWLKLIDDFLESDMDCVRIEDYTNKDKDSCYAALYNAIKRYRKSGIRLVMRNGEVYLIKEL